MRTLALRRRPWLVPVSLGVHVAIVLALFVAGFWKIERLDAGRRTLDLAVSPPPPAAASGSPAAPAAEPFKKKRPRVAEVIVQPPEIPRAPEAATSPSTSAGSGAGNGDGTGSGEGSGSGTGTDRDGVGECQAPPCGPPAAMPIPIIEEPKTVAPTVIKGLRLSGETQIHPPAPVKTAILRDGQTRVTATFKVCVGTRGEIASLGLFASSGYPDYDRALTAGLRSWRYKPYAVNGRAVPVCGMVTFIYAMR